MILLRLSEVVHVNSKIPRGDGNPLSAILLMV